MKSTQYIELFIELENNYPTHLPIFLIKLELY